MAVVLTELNFETTIAKGVTLVDFWAEWCGPCQAMLPVLESFSDEVEGKMTVWKINVDECPNIASKFRIMSIPTLILFQDGQAKEMLVGAQPKQKLQEICAKYL